MTRGERGGRRKVWIVIGGRERSGGRGRSAERGKRGNVRVWRNRIGKGRGRGGRESTGGGTGTRPYRPDRLAVEIGIADGVFERAGKSKVRAF